MEQPLRILHVIGIMNRGGAETMIMNLYRNIDRSKIQFDFVENSCDNAAYDREIESLGGKIFRCPHYNGKNHFQYKKWWNSFFQTHSGEYQIIHGHIGSTAAIYLKIAKRYGLYTIAHSHSSGTDRSLKSLLYQVMSRPTRSIADWFFACSDTAGRDRYGASVVSGDRYKVLNNAVDTKIFQFNPVTRAQTRAHLAIDQYTVLGHIGRFTGEKNHAFVLKIFKEILLLDPNCRLLLIGDGPLKRKMQGLAEELGVAENVLFLGIRSDVNRLVQAMDLLIFPSIYEGLPVTLVEAQTSGLPCVISDHIPKECILTHDLVTIMSLESSAFDWAKHCLSRTNENRFDRRLEIIDKGYDIKATARWLQGFYEEMAEKHA